VHLVEVNVLTTLAEFVVFRKTRCPCPHACRCTHVSWERDRIWEPLELEKRYREHPDEVKGGVI